jgi:hypothetical protein
MAETSSRDKAVDSAKDVHLLDDEGERRQQSTADVAASPQSPEPKVSPADVQSVNVVDKSQQDNASVCEKLEQPGTASDHQEQDAFYLKRLKWNGKTVPVLTQNENGPCPLVALCNVLLLRGDMTLSSDAELVTGEYLLSLLGDLLIRRSSTKVRRSFRQLGIALCIAANFQPLAQFALAVTVACTIVQGWLGTVIACLGGGQPKTKDEQGAGETRVSQCTWRPIIQ